MALKGRNNIQEHISDCLGFGETLPLITYEHTTTLDTSSWSVQACAKLRRKSIALFTCSKPTHCTYEVGSAGMHFSLSNYCGVFHR